MTITVKIILGDDALKYAKDGVFLEKWKTLADNTAHKTVFQEPDFVSLWFHHYQQYFEPVLVIGLSESEELIGLIPLAIDKKDAILTQAGAQLAEYSGWLCSKMHNDEFLSKAFQSIKVNISFSLWKWTYIAPGADTTWLQSYHLKNIGIYARFETIDSPVLDLHNKEKLKKVLKNKSVKSKINRLKRKGELKIERITEQSRALELMDQVTNLVNFRHESAHHDAAFEEDHLQRSFYEARSHNLKDNHFSVLWLGNKLLAFHFGYIDNDSIYISLTAFDPTESKHSPGVIFLIYLANLLIEEGIRYIDLTPGGDEYKERFSNAHNKLYLPTINTNKLQHSKQILKNNCKSLAITALEYCNIDKDKLKIHINKRTKKRTYNQNDFDLFSISSENYKIHDAHPNNNINIQSYSDLLNYQENDSGISRQEILSDATYRFSREDTLFTIHNNSRLQSYSWLSKLGSKYSRLGFNFSNEKNSVVIDCMNYNLKLINNDHMKILINSMLNHAFSKNAQVAFLFIPHSENIQIHIETLNEIGFEKTNFSD
ncbi:MAG: GNAT family N-acetyltransferase [Gammaproteobacteria bacterium]|nr:GNAT family N-acetyltransferase [Gammaproteobacteria bacterium]